MAEMSIITQPLKTISAAKGKMTQKAICGKDADMGGLLYLRPRRIAPTGHRGNNVYVQRRKNSSVRDVLNLERLRNKGEPGRSRTCNEPLPKTVAAIGVRLKGCHGNLGTGTLMFLSAVS